MAGRVLQRLSRPSLCIQDGTYLCSAFVYRTVPFRAASYATKANGLSSLPQKVGISFKPPFRYVSPDPNADKEAKIFLLNRQKINPLYLPLTHSMCA